MNLMRNFRFSCISGMKKVKHHIDQTGFIFLKKENADMGKNIEIIPVFLAADRSYFPHMAVTCLSILKSLFTKRLSFY